MSTFSKQDVVTRCLRDLSLISAEEAPSPDDLAFGIETLESVFDQLSAESIQFWNTSSGSVARPYLVALSKRLALDVGPAFGLGTIAEAEAAKQAANFALRQIGPKAPTGAVQQGGYF